MQTLIVALYSVMSDSKSVQGIFCRSEILFRRDKHEGYFRKTVLKSAHKKYFENLISKGPLTYFSNDNNHFQKIDFQKDLCLKRKQKNNLL